MEGKGAEGADEGGDCRCVFHKTWCFHMGGHIANVCITPSQQHGGHVLSCGLSPLRYSQCSGILINFQPRRNSGSPRQSEMDLPPCFTH